MSVEKYIAKGDIESALENCLLNNSPHLGLLLGMINPKSSPRYHELIASLQRMITKDKQKKKDEYIRVKVMCNWCSSEDLVRLWDKMSKGSGTWNRIKIVSSDPADYFVIINAPQPTDTFDRKKTIVFRMEPNMESDQRWGEWSNPSDEQFLLVARHEKGYYNNCEWHLSRTWSELQSEVVKNEAYNNILSTVLSAKYTDPGHIRRVGFIKYLEEKGLPVHVYGSNRWDYKDYKGSLPPYEKDNAIFPYKYVFNMENQSIPNYFTEKLIDGILGECLVFYSGCYNVRDYIDERAYVYLHLSNFEHDYNIIKKAIEEDWHSQRLPYIRKAKEKILNELQFFPRLEKIILSHKGNNPA